MLSGKAPVGIRNSEAFALRSKAVGEEYEIRVQLPRGYDGDGSKTWPALYLTDADECFGMVSDLLYMLQAEGVPGVILVGIAYGADFFDPERNHRMRDYMPESGAFPGQPAEGGGGASFADFILDEVAPRVEASYRADPERRFYAGTSAGGVLGLYLMLKRPGNFAGYLISSPALWWADRASFRHEKDYADANRDLAAKVYMAIGDREEDEPFVEPYRAIRNVEEMAAALRSRGYPSLELVTRIEAGAHLSSQGGTFSKGLLFLFPPEIPGSQDQPKEKP